MKERNLKKSRTGGKLRKLPELPDVIGLPQSIGRQSKHWDALQPSLFSLALVS